MSKWYAEVFPSCKSKNVVPIEYGFPGDEMNKTTFIILSGTILFVDIVFIALSLGINKNNAEYLLADYNTMSKDDR